MKKHILIFFAAFALLANLQGQESAHFTHQVVLRDLMGKPLANDTVEIMVQIHENNISSLIYAENHHLVCNAHGMVTIEVGKGEPHNNYNFGDIDWGNQENKYLSVIVNNNMANRVISQIRSVPFALVAKNTGNIKDADADSTNELQYLTAQDSLVMLHGKDGSVSSVVMGFPRDGVQDADADSTNELVEQFSFEGQVLTIGDRQVAKSFDLGYLVNDADSVVGNETIDSISIAGDTLYIHESGHVSKMDISMLVNSNKNINDADSVLGNELQTLGLENHELTLTRTNKKIPMKKYTRDSQQLKVLSATNDTVTIGLDNSPPVTINIKDGDHDPGKELQGLGEVLNKSADAGGHRITDLATPVDDADMANRQYADQVYRELEKDMLQTHPGNMMYFGRNWGKFYDEVNDEIYKFTRIENQIWMAENLRSRYSRDSVKLLDSELNASLYKSMEFDFKTGIDKYDSIYYVNHFGFIYSVADFQTTIIDSLCPAGWRLPDDNDWSILSDKLQYINQANLEEKNLAKYILANDADNAWKYYNSISTTSDLIEKNKDYYSFSLRGGGFLDNNDLTEYRIATRVYSKVSGGDGLIKIRLTNNSNWNELDIDPTSFTRNHFHPKVFQI